MNVFKTVYRLIFILGLLLNLYGCKPTIEDNRTNNLAIYTQYYPEDFNNVTHITKGRGVCFTDYHSGPQIITAAHVLNEYGNNNSTLIVDTYGREEQLIVDYIFDSSIDLALAHSIERTMGYESKIGYVSEGDNVYSFYYPKETEFDDFFIPKQIVSGPVISPPEKVSIWDNSWGVMARYKGAEGMSGGGVYNQKGELVGIHTASNEYGTSVFVPIREAVYKERFKLMRRFGKKWLIKTGLMEK